MTSDFIVDCLTDFWSQEQINFPKVSTLLINQDNGPECNGHRTQFMKRITDFADEFQITVQLAYYPPYHSKYNPAERVWAALENKWNGSLLDSIDNGVFVVVMGVTGIPLFMELPIPQTWNYIGWLVIHEFAGFLFVGH